MEWVSIAVQAGGAIAVCGMFLAFLIRKQTADDAARREFLNHLSQKDVSTATAMNKQMEYLQSRDAQSKEIAMSGHAALKEVAEEVQELRSMIHGMREHAT